MKRTLLALALVLFASAAFAADPEPAATPQTVCPKSEPVQDKAAPSEAGPAATRPGTPAPVRQRGASGKSGGPRWHSLLPGMML